jgi:hypothetical protein
VIHVADAAGLQAAIQSAVDHIVADDEIPWMPMIKLAEGQRLGMNGPAGDLVRMGCSPSEAAGSL